MRLAGGHGEELEARKLNRMRCGWLAEAEPDRHAMDASGMYHSEVAWAKLRERALLAATVVELNPQIKGVERRTHKAVTKPFLKARSADRSKRSLGNAPQ
jgi:hypothetical protein